MQPTIIKTNFSLLQCRNIYRADNSLQYLVQDYDLKCWEGEHLNWVLAHILPSLFLWVVILPGLMLYILRKNRRALHTKKVAMRYSFVYNGYATRKYYWEFVILIRKLLLIATVVFPGADAINLQIYGFLVVSLLSFMLHVRNSPYSNVKLNTLERMSLASVVIVAQCGLYFQIIGHNKVLNALAAMVGFIGSFYFLIPFVKLFFSLQIIKLQQNKKVMKAVAYLNEKLCCCLRTKLFKRLHHRAGTTFRMISLKTRSVISFLKDDFVLDEDEKRQGTLGKDALGEMRSSKTIDEKHKRSVEESGLDLDKSNQAPLNMAQSILEPLPHEFRVDFEKEGKPAVSVFETSKMKTRSRRSEIVFEEDIIDRTDHGKKKVVEFSENNTIASQLMKVLDP